MATPNSQTTPGQQSSDGWKKGTGISIMIGVVVFWVLTWVWNMGQEFIWWLHPTPVPAVKGEHHWGTTLHAGDNSWTPLESEDGTHFKVFIALTGNPTLEDFAVAKAQIKGRVVYLDGHRGDEQPLSSILRSNPVGIGAIEVTATKGKHRRIWLSTKQTESPPSDFK